MEDVASNYFTTINSMANRICVDLQETRASYENLWETLPVGEQEQILSDSIIKPEVSLKYSPHGKTQSLRPVQQEYSMKVVVDDHCSFRDEHSGPFTFRTASQRDLTLFTAPVLQPPPSKPPSSARKTAKSDPTVPALSDVVKQPQRRQIEETSPPLVPQVQDSMCISSDCRPADVTSSSDSLSQFLPKTGLDFLDNW